MCSRHGAGSRQLSVALDTLSEQLLPAWLPGTSVWTKSSTPKASREGRGEQGAGISAADAAPCKNSAGQKRNTSPQALTAPIPVPCQLQDKTGAWDSSCLVLPQMQTSLRLWAKVGLRHTAKVPTAASLPAEGICTDQPTPPPDLPLFLHHS